MEIKKFIKEHKKEIIIVGGSIIVITGSIIFIKKQLSDMDNMVVKQLLDANNVEHWKLVNPENIKAAFATVEYKDGGIKIINDIAGLAQIMARPCPK